jgi:hypothetical protein
VSCCFALVARLFGMDGMGWDGTRASHLGACHSGLFYQLLAVPFVLASGNGSLHLGGW